MNFEPAICNSHLPYPWGCHLKEGRMGSWMQEVGEGGGEAPHLGEGRGFFILMC